MQSLNWSPKRMVLGGGLDRHHSAALGQVEDGLELWLGRGGGHAEPPDAVVVDLHIDEVDVGCEDVELVRDARYG